MFPAFLQQRCWSTPSPLYRRAVTDRAGPWTNLQQEEDWEYDCRIASFGVHLLHCDEFVAEISMDHQNSLSSKWSIDKEFMKDRVKARELIFKHACKANIAENSKEMKHFSRELFLIARQCGKLGLPKESRKMFELSCIAAGKEKANALDFTIYKKFAQLLGWEIAGKITCCIDKFRR